MKLPEDFLPIAVRTLFGPDPLSGIRKFWETLFYNSRVGREKREPERLYFFASGSNV